MLANNANYVDCRASYVVCSLNFALLALLLGGCASHPYYVSLNYPPDREIEVDLVESYEGSEIDLSGCSIQLSVVDARDDKIDMGKVYTGIITGLESRSTVLTETNVTSWVYDAVQAELSLLGFPVIEADAHTGEHPGNALRVDLQQLKVGCYLACNGSAVIRSSLLSGIEEATVTIEGTSSEVWPITHRQVEVKLGQAADSVLQSAVKRSLTSLGLAGGPADGCF